MLGDRYVLLGLARPRAGWFSALARWSTSAAIPAEFVKCVSPEELRTQLRSGRAVSAVLIDGGLPAADRDLLATVRDAGAVALVVDEGRVRRDWIGLGASAVLPPHLTREILLDTLVATASMIPRTEPGVVAGMAEHEPAPTPWDGRLAAVCGAGGTGASSVAIALAQGLAGNDGTRRRVLLADLCLQAEQGMLHDARELFPGVQELVEAHRSGAPSVGQVRGLCYEVVERGYHLLLGLRRARYWSTVRPRAFRAALTSLRSSYEVVICDVDADFEDEDDAGSADVADRCMLSRLAVEQADAVFAVGVAGFKGLHSLMRVVGDLLHAGVAAERIQPVINVAPRHPHARSELAGTLADLARPTTGSTLAPALFLPRRRVGEALRDGAPVPAPLPQLLAGACRKLLEAGQASWAAPSPERVKPGSVGTWTISHEEAAGA